MSVMFATIGELASYLKRTIPNNDARATLLLQLASSAIQRETRQTIAKVVDDVIKIQGSWGRKVTLPQRPVLAVTEVKIDGDVQVADTDYTWELGLDELTRPFPWESDPERAVRFVGGFWGGVNAVVSVKYTHGYDVIPDDIKAICLEAAARAWVNPTSEKAETIKNYSAQHADATGVRLSKDEKIDLRAYRRRAGSVLIK